MVKVILPDFSFIQVIMNLPEISQIFDKTRFVLLEVELLQIFAVKTSKSSVTYFVIWFKVYLVYTCLHLLRGLSFKDLFSLSIYLLRNVLTSLLSLITLLYCILISNCRLAFRCSCSQVKADAQLS